jgi:hypothetical protein
VKRFLVAALAAHFVLVLPAAASAGGAAFRTRPRYVEPGSLVSIRTSFGRVPGMGGVGDGPYGVFITRTKPHSGQPVGPSIPVGTLRTTETPQWGFIAYSRFVVPGWVAPGTYLIEHHNLSGKTLEEVTQGWVRFTRHPDMARARYYRIQRHRN